MHAVNTPKAIANLSTALALVSQALALIYPANFFKTFPAFLRMSDKPSRGFDMISRAFPILVRAFIKPNPITIATMDGMLVFIKSIRPESLSLTQPNLFPIELKHSETLSLN